MLKSKMFRLKIKIDFSQLFGGILLVNLVLLYLTDSGLQNCILKDDVEDNFIIPHVINYPVQTHENKNFTTQIARVPAINSNYPCKVRRTHLQPPTEYQI